MLDTTIHRDAEGRAALTTEQAEALFETEMYAETVASVAKQAVACGGPPDFRRMWFDAESSLDDLRAATAAELTRLRAIETAAGEVLASGQARYEIPPSGALPYLLGDPESRYVGDLVPAAAMIALAEAVHGAKMSTAKPPAASDEYARELEAALTEGGAS